MEKKILVEISGSLKENEGRDSLKMFIQSMFIQSMTQKFLLVKICAPFSSSILPTLIFLVMEIQ